ncbi:histidine phosphatase family protein [Nocardia sp. NPDC051750]|uniref:histidine phosphatase family protein n=1 Tax=Nocardia sp. NPDC051750 TaxID=3364325 RepID=UPI00378D971B
MTYSVALVRHAQSVSPTPNGPGDYHRPLSRLGETQAMMLSDELVETEPRAIFSSPYLRALQTIEPTAQRCNQTIRTDQRLREWDSGIEPTPDYARRYEQSWARPWWARSGAESLNELTERAVDALNATIARAAGPPVIIGSHGTFIARALVGFGCPGIDAAFHRAMPMPAVYRLVFSDRHVRVTGPGLCTL